MENQVEGSKQEESSFKSEVQTVKDKSYSSIKTDASGCASVVSKGNDNSYDNNSVKSRKIPTTLSDKSSVEKQVALSNTLVASSQNIKETLQLGGLREEEQAVEDKSYSSINTIVSEHASVVSEGNGSSYGGNNNVKCSDVPTSLGSKSSVKKPVAHRNSLAALKNEQTPQQGDLREESQSLEERLYSSIKADVSYCASAVSKGSMKCRKLPPILCHISSLKKSAADYNGASDCKNKTRTQKAVVEKEVHSVEKDSAA